ncbi:PucR family transcriptional regulator [Listeria sp. ILCC792]|uniref:PucR family transcriptional regulator n=1 Tax=Listeria sp. ILCC792 TaxID=1918331 RepID=UPI000B58B1CF|nr:PucR family transcriptional regulator [Listeria sp. ILCC792]
MSVKLEELLKLPSLREAKVVAGKTGLKKLVSSISVLEHTDVEILEDALFDNDEFYGSEIVISAFINIKDNVDAQCNMIERLHHAGEVALILYYVGIFMPKVDEKLIRLANKLDFTLIVMPENEMTLRYSEVIYEVVEAIVKQEMRVTHFASELLEQISNLPNNQRNIDTMLKILTDRTRSSIVLTDNSGEIVHAVTWPRINTIALDKVIHLPITEKIEQHDQLFITKRPLMQDGIKMLQLFLIKENEALTEELAAQMTEVVQVFMNLWGEKYSEISTSELVKAILNNESVKMRRLAKILGIDVASIQTMWLIEAQNAQANEQALQKIQSYFSAHFQVSLVDFHDDFIVALMDNSLTQGEYDELAKHLLKELDVQIIICGGQENTTDVQQSYATVSSYFEAAKIIYPLKTIFSIQEVMFAAECYEIVNKGERAISEQLKLVQPLFQMQSQGEELLQTLAVFLLDTENNMGKAADVLFLHKNTIKYRLARLHEILQYPVTKLPESYNLYTSVAIWRLLQEMNQT